MTRRFHMQQAAFAADRRVVAVLMRLRYSPESRCLGGSLDGYDPTPCQRNDEGGMMKGTL